MKNKQPRSKQKRDPKEHREAATAVAIAALSFIATDPEQLGRFLSLTGIGPESIRTAAREPGFLLGVLDHMAGDERLLLAFAAHEHFAPDDIRNARDILAGGNAA